MKILKTLTYKNLLNDLEHREKTVGDQSMKIVRLEKELAESKELKELLTCIVNRTGIPDGAKIGDYLTFGSNGASWSGEIVLPDKVPVYVDDYFGGKVIKQEATKVIHITKSGEILTGLTKEKSDKGFIYLLQRD